MSRISEFGITALFLAMLGSAGCGSHEAAGQAGAETGENVVASPGKPMPNAAVVRTEAVHAVQDGSEVRISVAPKEGVRLVSIRFPAQAQVELLRQETVSSANGKLAARHLFDLGVKSDAEQQEFTALLELESNGKRFGQLVRIPMQAGVTADRALPKPSEQPGDDIDGQRYPVKEMPAKQEIIRD